MKNKNFNESWFIKKCKCDIALKFFCDSKKKFKHSDFIRLSEEIYKSSNILLGTSTLVRIFRDNYSKIPHLTTLDALAKYLEYENWNDFKRKYVNVNIVNGVKLEHYFFYKNRIIAGAVIFAIALIIGLFFIYKNYRNKKNIENSIFYFTYENNNELPLIRFHFNLNNLDFENAQIWPFGKDADNINLSKNDTTKLYGYTWYETFHPKLVVDGKVIKELTVDVKSSGWKAGVSKLTNDEFFQEYWEDKQIFTNGELGISDEIVKLHNFTYNDFDQSYYVNARDFNTINGDTLIFETRIKNKQISKNTKSGIHRIILDFEKAMILIPIAEEKRYNLDIPLGLFDIWLFPDKNDLSMLNINQLEWNKINITTNSKVVTIKINDKKVFFKAYKSDAGMLKRIDFLFNGMGLVDYVRFYNTNGKLIYHDEFE